jgi:hypothetical protein
MREELLVLDETVIDSHGGDANLVILSLGIRKCQFENLGHDVGTPVLES